MKFFCSGSSCAILKAAGVLVSSIWIFLVWAMLPGFWWGGFGLACGMALYFAPRLSVLAMRYFVGLIMLLALLAGVLLLRPVSKGYYVVAASVKDVIRASVLPNSLSKIELIRSIIGVDLRERLLGDKAESVAFLGPWAFKAQNSSVMKSLLIDIFLRQDYHYPIVTSDNPFIIDCGGNVGFTILYFKLQYPHAKILAFEPDPQNFSLLQDNLKRAGLTGIELQKLAVSDKAGVVNFIAATVGGRIDLANEGIDGISVEAVPLSRFINRPVDILKMDIEGAETLVLRELDASGKIADIKNIIMEFHYTAVDSNGLGEVLSMLERRNFRFHIEALPGMTPSFDGNKKMDGYLRCLMIYATQKSS